MVGPPRRGTLTRVRPTDDTPRVSHASRRVRLAKAEPIRAPRGIHPMLVDGDTIYVYVLRSLVEIGDEGNIYTVIQTPRIDALIADGYIIEVPAPTPPPPGPYPVNVTTGPQDFSSGQQAQVDTNLGIGAKYGPGGTAGNVSTATGDGRWLKQAGGTATGPLLLKKGPVIDVASLISDPANGTANAATLNALFSGLATDDSYAGRRVKFTPVPGTSGANIKVAGSVLVPAMSGLEISGDDAFLEQATANKVTLDVAECPDLAVVGLNFRGKGTEIAGTSGASTSWNGVAGLRLKSWQRAHLERLHAENHAGGSFRWNRTGSGDAASKLWMIELDAVGVGTAGGIAAGDNRSDFGISDTGQTFSGPMAEIWARDCTVSQHTFGLGFDYVSKLHVLDCDVDQIIGQHGLYADHCSWGSIKGFHGSNVGLTLLKWQLSGAANLSGTDHLTIDDVKGDTIGQNVLIIGYVDGTWPYRVKHAQISRIEGKNVAQDVAYFAGVQHASVSDVSGETVGRYGINLAGFSGTIDRPRLVGTQQAGIFGYISDYTRINSPEFVDVALNAGAGVGTVFSTHIDLLRDPTIVTKDTTGATVTGVASAVAVPVVEINNPVHRAGYNPSTGATTAEPTTLTSLYATTSDLAVRVTRPRNLTTKSALTGITNLAYYDAGAPATPAPTSPLANGYLAANDDPGRNSTGQGAVTLGTLYLIREHLVADGVIGHIRGVVLSGAAGSNTLIALGIYDAVTGVLLGTTADQTSNWSGTGARPAAAVSAASGQSLAMIAGAEVFVGILVVGGTAPNLRGPASGTLGVANDNLTGLALRFATGGTGLSALPTTLGTLTALANMQPFVALAT